MKVYDSLSQVDASNIAITIGNFDGVHLGHRDILKTIQSECDQNKQELVVVTFVPHPMHILSPKSNFLLNTYDERRNLIEELGVKHLVEIEFSRDLSTYSPEKFMDDYILCNKKVCKFYVGHDFAFGANKKGDHNFVKNYCAKRDIDVVVLEQHFEDKSSVSSSIVRNHLDKGDIEHANKILGRNFFIKGRVIKGEGRGKKIGVPTANLSYNDVRKVPQKGVYITETRVGTQKWQSVTNIGNNPTFNDTNTLFVETHILDFDNDIYGDSIEVSFLEKIREEKKFSSVNDLINQINEDVDNARKYFKK